MTRSITNRGPHITRAALRVMKPDQKARQARIEALEEAADQCELFYHWPALIESLRADASRIRNETAVR
jgi:hypothetical protein